MSNSQNKSPRREAERPRSQPRNGFTLVELLVVIAVIGVLSALLLPGLSRAKAKAQRIVCVNNLHQWATAMHLYTDDNQDFLPRESAFTPGTSLNFWVDVQGEWTSDVWYNTLPPQRSGLRASNYFNMKNDFYERSSIFQCPSAKITIDKFYARFAIAMNSKLIKSGLPFSVNDLCHTESTVMFLDNLLDGEPRVVLGNIGSLGQPSSYASRFSARHAGLGNLIFWDSHIESLAGREVVDTTPGGNYGQAISPQRRIVWDPCPAN